MSSGLPVSATRRVGPINSPTPKQAVASDPVEPEALVAAWWFDSGEHGEPYSASVRFTGRRIGIRGTPKSGDTFVKDETIDGMIPGTGPVSITTWVYGLEPGEWTVTAEPVRMSGGPGGRLARPTTGGPRTVHPASWSWRRWAISTGEAAPVRTRWALLAPLARQPAVLPGIYTALAIIGFVVALTIQSLILARSDLAIGSALAASLLAIVAGLIGAKAWYAVLHPDESIIRGGWAVDGFLVATPVVGALGLLAFDLPIGVVLDATAPGLFFAVVIGRLGCFFTGCCSGRCTASRWGIWSSDRRVGARRIPTQLIEAGAGLVIGITALVLVLGDVSPFSGAVFLLAFAVYAGVRQLLLRLRAEQRKSARTVPLTAVAAGLTVLVVAVLSALQGS